MQVSEACSRTRGAFQRPCGGGARRQAPGTKVCACVKIDCVPFHIDLLLFMITMSEILSYGGVYCGAGKVGSRINLICDKNSELFAS